jgi:hypothetical protein
MNKNISIIISKKNKYISNNNNIIKNHNIDCNIDCNIDYNIDKNNKNINIFYLVNYFIKHLIIKFKYLLIVIIFIIFVKNT